MRFLEMCDDYLAFAYAVTVVPYSCACAAMVSAVLYKPFFPSLSDSYEECALAFSVAGTVLLVIAAIALHTKGC